MSTCPKCNKELPDEFTICDACGAEMREFESEEQVNPAIAEPVKTKKSIKKPLGIAVAAIALVLIAAIMFSVFGGLNSDTSIIAYLKDKELFISNLSNAKAQQVSEKLYDYDTSKEDFYNSYVALPDRYVYYCKDGNTLFYPDKLEENLGNGLTIYCRSLKNMNTAPVKIDSGIFKYYVSGDSKLVTYLKREDSKNSLYQHDLTDKEKIGGNISSFFVSDDGKNIVFLNYDGDLYSKFYKSEKVKIDSGVSRISHVTDDFSDVYYIKDSTLYKKSDGNETQKLVSDINKVISIYDSGEMYYYKSSDKKDMIKELLVDDMKQKDATITKPTAPEYPVYDENFEASVAQYNKENEKYLAALSEYNSKVTREKLRSQVNEIEFDDAYFSLYYFDGKKETLLSDTFCQNYSNTENNKTFVYSAFNKSKIKQIKFSEIDNMYSIKELINAAVNAAQEKFVSVSGQVFKLEHNELSSPIINKSGNEIYYYVSTPEKSFSGYLYKVTVSGTKLSKPKVYDSNVYDSFIRLDDDGNLLYYKNYVEHVARADLYYNKKKVDSDVDINQYFDFESNRKAICYITDRDKESQLGTLKKYENGKLVKVADNVAWFYNTCDGTVCYLSDYSSENKGGQLFEIKNGKSVKLNDEIFSFILLDEVGGKQSFSEPNYDEILTD